MNHIAANRVKKKLKIKMRNIWEHVTHPHSHNPLFRLWGHASKSRQLPHSGKAFRQHLLPLQFMRNASKMSQTTGVSSVKSARNVAGASNSCVSETRFARLNPCSIFRQLPFWLSAFRMIRTGNAKKLDFDPCHRRRDAQFGDRV